MLTPLCFVCGRSHRVNRCTRGHTATQPKTFTEKVCCHHPLPNLLHGLPRPLRVKLEGPEAPAHLFDTSHLFFPSCPPSSHSGHAGFGAPPTKTTTAHLLYMLSSFPLKPLNHCFCLESSSALCMTDSFSPGLSLSVISSKRPFLSAPSPHYPISLCASSFIACFFPSLHFCRSPPPGHKLHLDRGHIRGSMIVCK